MKQFITIILLAFGFSYISQIEIKFNPFKISFGDLTYGFGWLFLIMAICCFQLSSFRKGNMSGYKEACHDILVEFNKSKKD